MLLTLKAIQFPNHQVIAIKATILPVPGELIVTVIRLLMRKKKNLPTLE
ncbi:hypothetical protein [Arsenophonus nasoniae]|nr:hypothetical protein [Arsenophonus nasoniae]